MQQHRWLSCPAHSPALGSSEPKEAGECWQVHLEAGQAWAGEVRHLGAWAAETEDFEDGLVQGVRSHRGQERGTESGDWAERLSGK